MTVEDLEPGQAGSQSTEFADQSQGQAGQSQGFQPRPDPAVGTEDVDSDVVDETDTPDQGPDLVDGSADIDKDNDDEDAPDADNPNDVGEDLPQG